jgi:hypothetical protein
MLDDQIVLDLTKEESEAIQEMTILYKKVKKLIIDTEELNENEKDAFAPPLLELRSALDHLMRVSAFKFGYKIDVQDDYPRKNLFKAKGHLFRAAYDSLDYLSIEITNAILDKVEPYSNEAIREVIPEYFDKIRPDLDDISKTIASIRVSKDMDDKNCDDLDRYIAEIDKLRSYHQDVMRKKNSLTEYEMKAESKRKSESNRALRNGIIAAVIGGAIVLIIKMLLS